MSTDMHNSGQNAGELPVHKDVSFEPKDLQPGTILRYLFYLAVVIVISLVICVYVLRFTTRLAVEQERPVPPVRQNVEIRIPQVEPPLQGTPVHETDAQQDLRDKIKTDTEANERLGWIDQKDGIAQIPVDDAMKLIEKNGLPAVTPPPAEKKK
jgi:hypothetical protein